MQRAQTFMRFLQVLKDEINRCRIGKNVKINFRIVFLKVDTYQQSIALMKVKPNMK